MIFIGLESSKQIRKKKKMGELYNSRGPNSQLLAEFYDLVANSKGINLTRRTFWKIRVHTCVKSTLPGNQNKQVREPQLPQKLESLVEVGSLSVPDILSKILWQNWTQLGGGGWTGKERGWGKTAIREQQSCFLELLVSEWGDLVVNRCWATA